MSTNTNKRKNNDAQQIMKSSKQKTNKPKKFCLLQCQDIENCYSNGPKRKVWVQSLTNKDSKCRFSRCDCYGFVNFATPNNDQEISLCPHHADECTNTNYAQVTSKNENETAETFYESNGQWKSNVKSFPHTSHLKRVRSKAPFEKSNAGDKSLSAQDNDAQDNDAQDNHAQDNHAQDDDESDDDESVLKAVSDVSSSSEEEDLQEDNSKSEQDNDAQDDAQNVAQVEAKEVSDTSSSSEEDVLQKEIPLLQQDNAAQNDAQKDDQGDDYDNNGGDVNYGDNDNNEVDSSEEDAELSEIMIVVTVKRSWDETQYYQTKCTLQTVMKSVKEEVEKSAGTAVVLCHNGPRSPILDTVSLHQIMMGKEDTTELVLYAAFIEWSVVIEKIGSTTSVQKKLVKLIQMLEICYRCVSIDRLNDLVTRLTTTIKRLVNTQPGNNCDIAEDEMSIAVIFKILYLLDLLAKNVAIWEIFVGASDSADPTSCFLVKIESMINVAIREHTTQALNSITTSAGITTSADITTSSLDQVPRKAAAVTSTVESTAQSSDNEKVDQATTNKKASKKNKNKKASVKKKNKKASVKKKAHATVSKRDPKIKYRCACCKQKFTPPFVQLVHEGTKSSSFALFRSKVLVDGAIDSWKFHDKAYYAFPFLKCTHLTKWPDDILESMEGPSAKGWGMKLQGMSLTSFITTYVQTLEQNKCSAAYANVVNGLNSITVNRENPFLTVEFVQYHFYYAFGETVKMVSASKAGESYTNRSKKDIPFLESNGIKKELKDFLAPWKQDIATAIRYVLLTMTGETLKDIDFEDYVPLPDRRGKFNRRFMKDNKDNDLVLRNDLSTNTQNITRLLMKILFEESSKRLMKVVKKTVTDENTLQQIEEGVNAMRQPIETKAETVANMIHYHFLDVKKFVASKNGMNTPIQDFPYKEEDEKGEEEEDYELQSSNGLYSESGSDSSSDDDDDDNADLE